MFSFTVLATCETQQYSIQRENLLCFLFAAIYESVTGLSALLATSPFYLRQLGVLTSKNNQQGSVDHTEASLLLLVALQTLPKLPYYLAADLWRLKVLNNNLTNVTELNESWRSFRSVNNVWEIEVQLYSLLTSALKGGGSSQRYVTSHFTLRKETWYPLQKRLGGPQRANLEGISTRVQTLNLPLYSMSLYWLCYAGLFAGLYNDLYCQGRGL